MIVRNDQLYTDDDGFETANDEKEKRVDDVENPQLLVINGDDPIMEFFTDWPRDVGSAGNRNCVRRP